ncbi:MAG: hypothetical protein ACD_40C00271G0008 [uncultured bacterium]|nr:MAG: hypothetical protein ACD_40C00271G0008 [uncultured bacterium]
MGSNFTQAIIQKNLETSNWKTYHSTENNFSFKYPTQYSIDETNDYQNFGKAWWGLFVRDPTIQVDHPVIEGLKQPKDIFDITLSSTLPCTAHYIENLHLVDLGFNQILSTFKFTNNGLSIPPGTCTHTYQVETNAEELTAKQYYSMRCAEQRSKEKCLKIDIYNQKADDFSIPDKISDCTWQDAIYTQ